MALIKSKNIDYSVELFEKVFDSLRLVAQYWDDMISIGEPLRHDGNKKQNKSHC